MGRIIDMLAVWISWHLLLLHHSMVVALWVHLRWSRWCRGRLLLTPTSVTIPRGILLMRHGGTSSDLFFIQGIVSASRLFFRNQPGFYLGVFSGQRCDEKLVGAEQRNIIKALWINILNFMTKRIRKQFYLFNENTA